MYSSYCIFSLFDVSILCHSYILEPFIDIFSNIMQPKYYVNGLPCVTKHVNKVCLKTPYIQRFQTTQKRNLRN